MLDSLNHLGDIFTAKKYNLVRENKNGTYTKEHVSAVLDGKILDPTLSGNMPIDNTALNLSVKKLLELQGVDIKSLEGKAILDIGGGFTGLPFLMDGLESEINIVDPIFSTEINYEINRNKTNILKLVTHFDEKNYEHYQKGNLDKQKYLYNLNSEFNLILSDLRKWESLENKCDNFVYGNTKVNILPTTGEDITSIDNESQDLIFINHTITKNQVNPYILLKKSYELLKVGGKIYITESGKLDFSSFKLFNNEFKVDVIDSYYLNDKTILILEKL